MAKYSYLSNSQLQLKHKKWRRQVLTLSTGSVIAVACAIPSHGVSCFGLAYTIPRLSYCAYKMHKTSKDLARRGLNELDYTFGDLIMPAMTCGIAAAFGCLADGAAVLHDAASPHMMNFVQAIGSGEYDAISARIDVIQDPSSAFAAAIHLWDDGYRDLSSHLSNAMTNITNATSHPGILTSEEFLKALGGGVMGAFIGELVGKGVEVTSERTNKAIGIFKEDSTHPKMLTSDKFLRALGIRIGD